MEIKDSGLPPMSCCTTRAGSVKLLVLTCVMVAVSWFAARHADDFLIRALSWFGVAFFSIGFAAFPKAWRRAGKPMLVFSPKGIVDGQFGVGFIPWADVAEVRIYNVRGVQMIGIVFYDEKPYLERVSPGRLKGAAMNRSLGFPSVTFGFSGLSPGFEDVRQYLNTLGFELEWE